MVYIFLIIKAGNVLPRFPNKCLMYMSACATEKKNGIPHLCLSDIYYSIICLQMVGPSSFLIILPTAEILKCI